MRTFATIIVGFVLFIVGPSVAGEFRFEDTKEGIFKRLMEPPKSTSAPLFKVRGVENRITEEMFKVRGLTVRPKSLGGTEVVEEMVTVPKNRSGGNVNLAVLFSTNSHAIQPGSIPILDNLGAALVRPELKLQPISINGHTDSDGSESYNLRLSLNRALSVKQYLVNNHGISDSQLRIMGYGESLPLVENTSAENKHINRRVEITVVAPQ